jgi:hypothetical protein
MNDVFDLFRKDSVSGFSVEKLAEELDVDMEVLLDMTIDEILHISEKKAQEKESRYEEILSRRNQAVSEVKKYFKENGITNEDMTAMYFENVRKGTSDEN